MSVVLLAEPANVQLHGLVLLPLDMVVSASGELVGLLYASLADP